MPNVLRNVVQEEPKADGILLVRSPFNIPHVILPAQTVDLDHRHVSFPQPHPHFAPYINTTHTIFPYRSSSSSFASKYLKIAMTAVKQSTVTDFRENNRKTPTLKVFEEFETDQESNYGSSSEDIEIYSPKSVVSKERKWPATVKDVNGEFSGRRTRNQIERIRAEESHLGEDFGECLIARVSGAGYDLVDVMIFSRPASPLSGKFRRGSI
ncbi:hypothetical protein L1887_31778 [Cichorium endivia]|nr:hypothetical protein L1887_31778 [Cichorium endivia]